MGAIDQAEFHFSEGTGLAVGIMVGFLVFSVALDLTWRQLYRVSKHAKAPGVGLLAQFLVLPGWHSSSVPGWSIPRVSRSGCCSSRAAPAGDCPTISPAWPGATWPRRSA